LKRSVSQRVALEAPKASQPLAKRAPAAGAVAAAAAATAPLVTAAAADSTSLNGRVPATSPDLDDLDNVPPPPPKLNATQRLLGEGKQLKYEWDKCEEGPDKVRTGLQTIFAYMRAIHKADVRLLDLGLAPGAEPLFLFAGFC
jgi:hypothetical protein